MLDVNALDVWLERHPITPEQQTEVVLAHLIAAVLVVKEKDVPWWWYYEKKNRAGA